MSNPDRAVSRAGSRVGSSAGPGAATSNPARLHDPDPAWPLRAEECLAEVHRALVDLPGGDAAAYDHIGSTAVPDLAAKPYLDLQVRLLPLPSEAELSARLGPLGYVRALGSRPDSPGVHRDVPRGEEVVADEVWEKRLYVGRDGAVILHVRRSDSPWGRHTVWFRDWLRAHPDARDRYEQVKRTLAAANEGQRDFDDYTRAKTAFFDEVQHELTAWAATRQT